jgi:hypothetical protein
MLALRSSVGLFDWVASSSIVRLYGHDIEFELEIGSSMPNFSFA